MRYNLSLQPRAIALINELYDNREEYHPGSGTYFLEDLADAFIQLQRFPFSGPRVDVAIRRVVSLKTKHNVYYKVIDQTVEVLYIIHGRQDY